MADPQHTRNTSRAHKSKSGKGSRNRSETRGPPGDGFWGSVEIPTELRNSGASSSWQGNADASAGAPARCDQQSFNFDHIRIPDEDFGHVCEEPLTPDSVAERLQDMGLPRQCGILTHLNFANKPDKDSAYFPVVTAERMVRLQEAEKDSQAYINPRV